MEINASPLVSVIVPVYNSEKYLVTCVESIRYQTLSDIEIILVDDGSKDGCPAICDEFSKKDARIKVIHKQNGGVASARNAGIDIAKGEWLCFVDSDDYIVPETLSSCVSIGNSYDADQVRFLVRSFPADSVVPENIVKNEKAKVLMIESVPQNTFPLLQTVTNMPFRNGVKACGSLMAIFKRAIIVDNGLFFPPEEESLYEDYVFNIEVTAKCRKVVYTEYHYNYYRDTPGSRSKFREDKIDRAVQFYDYLSVKLTELGYPDAELACVSSLVGSLRTDFRNIFESDFSLSDKIKYHAKSVRMPIIDKIRKDGIYKKLPLAQRIAFDVRNSYWLSYLIISMRDWVKRKFYI